ncbi:MAG: ATP-dependent Clp protease adaptor ClpS [Treponema sp.]|nr:ATP-dependent Clp protease adaptor ClpS [Treponema sp.]
MAFHTDFSSDTDTIIDFDVPPSYKVILLNDDFTTMDFVVDILMTIFKKSEADAVETMLSVHKTGRGVAGVFPYDIAATKIQMTMRRAHDAGFPLKCTMEKV